MNRRKKKLIRLDLQLKIVFITLFVAALVLLINFQLTLAGLWSLGNQFLQNKSADFLIEQIRNSTIQKFLISVGMAVPLAASVGILYSFKFSGPIYRFKKYFTEIQDGRWDERCMLRKGDDLQDVAESINRGIDVMRVQLRRNHTLLQEVKTYLAEVPEPTDQGAQAQLSKIQAEIEEEDATFQHRFGVPTGSEKTVADADVGGAGADEAAAAASPGETDAERVASASNEPAAEADESAEKEPEVERQA